MKKVITFIIIIILLSTTYAFAYESINIDELSFEEITILNQRIQLKLFGYYSAQNGVILEPGVYEIGVDIPAGNYYFEGVKGRLPSSVSVYPSIDKMRTSYEIQSVKGFGYGYDCETNVTGKFILQEGWLIKIVQGPAIIHEYSGLFQKQER